MYRSTSRIPFWYSLSVATSRCRWQQKENILSELEELVISVKVHYGWAGDYGLLAMVIGTARYQTDTTLVYIPLTQLPNRHVSINDRSTSAQRDKFNAENNLLKRDWAVVIGFKKAVWRLGWRNVYKSRVSLVPGCTDYHCQQAVVAGPIVVDLYIAPTIVEEERVPSSTM